MMAFPMLRMMKWGGIKLCGLKMYVICLEGCRLPLALPNVKEVMCVQNFLIFAKIL